MIYHFVLFAMTLFLFAKTLYGPVNIFFCHGGMSSKLEPVLIITQPTICRVIKHF